MLGADPHDPRAPGDPGDQGDPGRAWGWVAALRAGSTTSWTQWPSDAGTAPATARDLPGAHQLELVRRVNAASAQAGAAPPRADLVERILTASATGRGAPDRELVGATPRRPWGLPPIDPTGLSEHDLLRFAATLLAEDLVATDRAARRSVIAPVAALPRRVRRRLSRRRAGHRVVGAPWQAATVRDEMLRRGRRLGGPESPDSTVVVVGQDAASMMVDAFTARAFDAGVAPWERWLGPGAGRALPRRADLSVVAGRWRELVGPDRVVVVTDATLLPSALGLPTRALARLTPARPGADAVDLARRVSAPLGLLVQPEVRRRLLRRVLLPSLLADDLAHDAAPLAVPESHLPWVVRRAEKMRDDLAAAGYPVVGDLQSLVPAVGAASASGAGPDDAGVLALAVRLLLAAPTPPPHDPSRAEERERR